MATAFTHALVGGALSSFSPLRPSPIRLGLVLAALAVVPDLDVLAFRAGIPYEHPLGHRGFTHSLLFAGVAGFLAAALFFRGLRVGSGPWWQVAVLLILATASHGILDALTDAGRGVGFFIPFDHSRFFFPLRPLATSPLSIRAFFEGPGLAILLNEVLWVWLPVGVILGIYRLLQRHTRRGAA